jgi:hypothetical protein
MNNLAKPSTSSFQCHVESSCCLRLAATSWFLEFIQLNSCSVPFGAAAIQFRFRSSNKHRFGFSENMNANGSFRSHLPTNTIWPFKLATKRQYAALNLSGRTFVNVYVFVF